jgi:FeS assembly SUF system regulator
MIRLTRMTDYSILLMTHCARFPERPIHTTRDLAAEAHLPIPTVGKILKLLARKGLMLSHRGVKGGYGLARRPEKVTLFEIVSAMEGPVALTDCADQRHDSCNLGKTCPVACHWQLINEAVRRALDAITLADMTKRDPDPILTLGSQSRGEVTTKSL